MQTAALQRDGIFQTNGSHLWLGILLGVALLTAGGWLFHQHQLRESAAVGRQALTVATAAVSGSHHDTAPPVPLVVQIEASHIRVTSISLGHPRLAVVNGKQVAEGEFITVHTPSAQIAVNLRVVKIADRRIDFSDGQQIITARISIPDLKSPRP